MLASRKYWSSVMSSLSLLSIMIAAFIIIGVLVGALATGPASFNPQRISHSNTTYHQQPLIEIINGTARNTNSTTTFATTSYYDTYNCTGNDCDWWRFRLALLLMIIALALFVLAWAFSVWGLTVQESMFLRGNAARAGSAYTGVEVVRPHFSTLGSIACASLGLLAIFSAILVMIAAVTGKHSSTFIASVIILVIFALIAALIMYMILFRTEEPMVLQPVYAAPVVLNGTQPVYVQNNDGVEYEVEPGTVPLESLGRRFSALTGMAPSYSPLRSRNPVVPSQ